MEVLNFKLNLMMETPNRLKNMTSLGSKCSDS